MKKRSLQQMLQSRVVITIEILIVVLLGIAIVREGLRRHDIDSEVSRLEQQIGKLETQNIQLAHVLKEMTSEDYLEKEARKKLDLQKPGETVVLLPQRPSAVESTDSDSTLNLSESRGQDTNPSRWWNYFFSQS